MFALLEIKQDKTECMFVAGLSVVKATKNDSTQNCRRTVFVYSPL